MIEKQIISSIEEIDRFLAEQNTETLEMKIFEEYEISEKGLELVEHLTKRFDDLKNNVKNIVLRVPYEKIPKSKFLPLLKLFEKVSQTDKQLSVCVLRKMNREFYEDEKKVSWDFKTILKANKDIDRICNFLKKSSLTPFEMLAFIHDYVSTIVAYNCQDSEKRTWASRNQYFPGAYLDVPDFVCAGYSSLMEEIIDNLNIPQLKCKILTFDFDNLEKNKTESHARCLITVKDKKYGLDQTVFDDPTWDNNEKLNHLYAHFAMPNNSMERNLNKKYHFHYPDSIEIYKPKSRIEFNEYFNLSSQGYNRSSNQISQEMIEVCYFNMLSKSRKTKSFEQVYLSLKKMAKKSFKEQEERKFEGNLKSENLMLSKEKAKKLFLESHKSMKNGEIER